MFFLNTSAHENHYISTDIKQILTKLKENYVFCPVDKAECNFAVIRKTFCTETLYTELNNNNTFKIYTLPPDVIVKKLMSFTRNSKISINNCKISFPFLFLKQNFT